MRFFTCGFILLNNHMDLKEGSQSLTFYNKLTKECRYTFNCCTYVRQFDSCHIYGFMRRSAKKRLYMYMWLSDYDSVPITSIPIIYIIQEKTSLGLLELRYQYDNMFDSFKFYLAEILTHPVGRLYQKIFSPVPKYTRLERSGARLFHTSCILTVVV